MVVGSLIRGSAMIYLMATVEIPGEAWARLIGMIVGTILGLICGIVMTSGGITMAMRKSLSSARSAAVIAAIPCFGGCVFPFGIWACVLVFSDRAKRDFGGR